MVLTVKSWPAADREWAAAYRMRMRGEDVPAPALDERERELLEAVHGARRSARELFGDPAALAAEDCAALATTEEAVSGSLGGGLRPALAEVGGTLLAIGAVAAGGTVVRSGSSADIRVADAVIAAGLLPVFLGWFVVRAVLRGGRSATAVGVFVSAGAIALVCLSRDRRELGPPAGRGPGGPSAARRPRAARPWHPRAGGRQAAVAAGPSRDLGR